MLFSARRLWMLAVAAAPLALGLGGCVTVDRVPGPSGQDSLLITCISTVDCYRRAADLCHGAYSLQANGVEISRMQPGPLQSRTNVLVSCTEGQPTRRRYTPPPEEAVVVAPEATNESRCGTAFTRIGELKAYWGTLSSSAKLKDGNPHFRDFIEVCVDTPENVQHCLDTTYRLGHDAECGAILAHIEVGRRARLDGLFLATVGGP